jgi:hypothetical protein
VIKHNSKTQPWQHFRTKGLGDISLQSACMPLIKPHAWYGFSSRFARRSGSERTSINAGAVAQEDGRLGRPYLPLRCSPAAVKDVARLVQLTNARLPIGAMQEDEVRMRVPGAGMVGRKRLVHSGAISKAAAECVVPRMRHPRASVFPCRHHQCSQNRRISSNIGRVQILQSHALKNQTKYWIFSLSP